MIRRVRDLTCAVGLSLSLGACGGAAPRATPTPPPTPLPTVAIVVIPRPGPLRPVRPPTPPTLEPDAVATDLAVVQVTRTAAAAARATAIAGGGAAAPTEAPGPSRVPNPATPEPSPPGPPAGAGGGLGLAQAAWEQQHGAPGPGSTATLALYEQGLYLVSFWSAGDTPVQSIVRQAPPGLQLPLATAEREGASLLPPDAQRQQTRTDPDPSGGPANTVVLYHSLWLSRRYLPDAAGPFPWGPRGPGTLALTYYGDGRSWSLSAGYPAP
ncbi:MAG TPA: hypothetical protein VKY74_05405 [Chloroflexia bacterium]|nr:hypothetical protein [Chloroflexia bacterium]